MLITIDTNNYTLKDLSHFYQVLSDLEDEIFNECFNDIKPLLKMRQYNLAKKFVNNFFKEVTVDGDSNLLVKDLLYYRINLEENNLKIKK